RRPRIAADGRVEDDAREPPDASVDAEETRTLEGAHRGLGRGVEVAGLLPVVRAGAGGALGGAPPAGRAPRARTSARAPRSRARGRAPRRTSAGRGRRRRRAWGCLR